MIKLKDFVKRLEELIKDGYGELPVVYSSDDEGNLYSKVSTLPDTFRVYDINKKYLDLGDVGEIPNCILVN